MVSNQKIINNYLKCYLIGAMEKTNAQDEGKGWRSRLRPELEKRIDPNKNPIYVFDPTLHEEEKVGMTTREFHEQMDKWIASGNLQKLKEGMECIWKGKTYIALDQHGRDHQHHLLGDIDYVRKSNFIILHIEEGDKPCLIGDTLITMADLSQKKLKDIKVGDKVLGTKTINKRTKFVSSEVLGKYDKGIKKVYKIKSNNNVLYCTPDHKHLIASKKGANIYDTTENILRFHKNIWDIEQPILNKEFFKGWVLGYLSHDAHIRKDKWGINISLVSDKKSEILIVKDILTNVGCKNIKIRERKGLDKRYPKNITYLLDIYNKHDYNIIMNIYKTKETKNFKLGWITGSIDADGWYDKWDIRYSQSIKNLNNYEKMIEFLTELKVKVNKQQRKRSTNFSKEPILDLMLSFSKKHLFLFPSQLHYKRKIKDKTINGIKTSKLEKLNTLYKKVFDITTSTSNFISNGIITHNCGTYAEAFLAYERNIPIYMIKTMALSKYNKSLLGWVIGSGGQIFDNQKQLLEFLDKKYKLKVKND